MSKISSFSNVYSLNKTLRMSLIPVGKTEENFNSARLLEEDQERARNYADVKKIMDNYHRDFIEDRLCSVQLSALEEYAALYFKSNRTESDVKSMEKIEDKLRKEISRCFTTDERYNKLFKADMIEELLPEYLTDEKDIETVRKFEKFSTYFTGFFENRKNMYTVEAKATGIGFRCINDNLPKFLDNVKCFEKIFDVLSDKIAQVEVQLEEILDMRLVTLFKVGGFHFVLSQCGIERYNKIIGGFTTNEGNKIQGINEYVNLYNQTVDKKDRLPLLKPLFKQILCASDTISFIPEKFESDQAVLDSIYDLWTNNDYGLSLEEVVDNCAKFIMRFDDYDVTGIYVKNGVNITDISNMTFGYWGAISDGWNRSYEEKFPMGKDVEKYIEKRKKAYKAITSFSLNDLQAYAQKASYDNDIVVCMKENGLQLCSGINENYLKVESILSTPYNSSKKLHKNDEAIEKIKNFLDSIKALEHFIKMFMGTGKEERKDDIFYGETLPLLSKLMEVDRLYDRVRNYMTQKPYSTEKCKLNFQNVQLLAGWDANKERDYLTVLLRKDEKYYLAIMNKGNNKIFIDFPYNENESYYEKMDYKLLPGPNKMLPKVFFATSNVEYYAPSEKILKIREKETFKKGNNFILEDCHALIDFYKESIAKHEDWSKFGFVFKNTEEYQDISQFYHDVQEQGYSISFRRISEAYIDEMIDTGNLYLFQIYNKDFSEKSHGTPNLHTMYFKMLFDERNLRNVAYQLNGGAEMFYREASICKNEIIRHEANKPIGNKNPLNPKKTSMFEYDIVKDKRFTKRQFSLHFPITLNFKAEGINNINHRVRESIRDCENNYIIGIDRGERNLLYVSVIDENANIIEQYSLNEIINECNGITYRTNYHELLDRKEKGRLQSRQNWKTIENIKELKEGYLSQVVHKICELVVKYDAIIAMENLNAGFKNSRVKVEKQVYQKFEKMLVDKLSFLVDKKISAEKQGGLLSAYQLVNKPDGKSKGKQNGFIFYIPAWLTSKIDPATGFVNLLRPKYTSVEAAKEYLKKFKSMRYNSKDDVFEFDFDYADFDGGTVDYKREWTICSYGERIRTYRNPAKNNEYDYEKIDLTQKFKDLLTEYGIISYDNLQGQILGMNEKNFYVEFIRLLSLTLQMRNSITGTDVDYLISPVRAENGKFFDSRKFEKDVAANMPKDADANGAYNIARKALYAIKNIKSASRDEVDKVSLAISNKQWLEFTQKEDV